MPVQKGRESVDGVTSQERNYGAIVGETRTYHTTVPSTLLLDEALDEGDSNLFPSASVRVIGRKEDGTLLVEVQQNTQAFDLGEMSWNVNCVSMQERTTVDVDGNAIIVSYPDALIWSSEITTALGDNISSFMYTKYEDQTAEAEVYIACEEIMGVRRVLVPAGGIGTYMTDTLRPWRHTLNENPFFGHLKGNVLCLGVDFRPESKRSNGDWICEERFKFMTRPGSPISDVVEGGGGWNTWHYWQDPNSGAIPNDVLAKKEDGAIVEAVHYRYKDFTVLYTNVGT